jgi:hypothetical protein
MGKMKSAFTVRRKSFDEGLKKPHTNVHLSGTVGRDLGFWMTAFLGFQTLGSIYGMSTVWPLMKAISGRVHFMCLRESFQTRRVQRLKMLLVLSVVLSGLSPWFPSSSTLGLSFVLAMIKEKV